MTRRHPTRFALTASLLLFTAPGCDERSTTAPATAPPGAGSVATDARRAAYAAAGLRLEARRDARADDGQPTVDAPFALSALVAPSPKIRVAERLLFAGAAEADALLAPFADPDDDPKPRGFGLKAGTKDPADPSSFDFLAAPASGLVAVPFSPPPPSGPGGYAADLPAPPPPVGADGFADPGAPAVPRFVAHDGLALYAQPSVAAATLMTMERADRVFVMPEAPVLAGGQVFVRAQAADRAPYPVGWIPLHWLYTVPIATTEDTLAVSLRYGLVAKKISTFFAENFYRGCDAMPGYPQDAWENAPTLVDAASIPASERYQCGELPVGEIASATRKRIATAPFDTPEVDEKLLKIDGMHFDVPIDLYRLDQQTRGDDYEIADLRTAYGSTFHSDVETIRLYNQFPDVEHDEKVRAHPSDAWFQLSHSAPAGVEHQGALAYVNACFVLPGGRLRAATFPVDITLQGPLSSSHVEAISLGALDFSSFRVCTTAAVEELQGDIGSVVSNEGAPYLRIQFLRATLSGVDVEFIEGVTLFGDFSDNHELLLGTLVGLLNGVMTSDAHDFGGFLWRNFFEAKLEQRLLAALVDVGLRLQDALPNPEAALHTACERLMPDAYKSPASPHYPLYLQCLESTQGAAITPEPLPEWSSCFDGDGFARANDGRRWKSGGSTTYVYATGEATPAHPGGIEAIERPWWVNGCRFEVEVETRAAEPFWPVLECAAKTTDRRLNDDALSGLGAALGSDCQLPAVKMLCDLYGDGDDLAGMWSESLGFVPDVDGAFGFCGLYDSLKPDDGVLDYTQD